MKSLARFLLFLFFILMGVLGWLFTIKNTVPVTLWLGFEMQFPLAVWILLAFGSGGLLGLSLGFGLWRHFTYRVKVKRLQQRLLVIESELLLARQSQDSVVRLQSGSQ
jgi:uncharacterized integral membrane protein